METAAQPSIDVQVNDSQTALRVDRERVAELVRRVLRGEGVHNASISITLVDDATIRRINGQYLNHDWPTDVISFPLSSPDAPELVAELVVSTETAVATAASADLPPWAELALYLVHGLLHICGFDDTSAPAAALMRRREREVLEALGLPNAFMACAQPRGPESAPCSA